MRVWFYLVWMHGLTCAHVCGRSARVEFVLMHAWSSDIGLEYSVRVDHVLIDVSFAVVLMNLRSFHRCLEFVLNTPSVSFTSG